VPRPLVKRFIDQVDQRAELGSRHAPPSDY
jgi:hypothetical protein